MKKIILVTLILFSTGLVTNAQKTNGFISDTKDELQQFKRANLPDTKTDYLAKSRNKKTAAWIFLGGGVLCTGVGILIFPKNYDYDLLWDSNSKSTENQATTSEIVMTIGVAAMLTSIPFFVSSSVYKRKASLTFSNQKTGFGVPANVSKDIVGITFKIAIGN